MQRTDPLQVPNAEKMSQVGIPTFKHMNIPSE